MAAQDLPGPSGLVVVDKPAGLTSHDVVARLRDNLDDLYVMSQPPPEIELEDRVFMPNPLVLIAPARHRLARQRGIELRELASERFILREPGSGTRSTVPASSRPGSCRDGMASHRRSSIPP